MTDKEARDIIEMWVKVNGAGVRKDLIVEALKTLLKTYDTPVKNEYTVKINNIPMTNTAHYIVARYCAMDNELWFWGAFDDLTEAKKAASEIEGVVCIRGRIK